MQQPEKRQGTRSTLNALARSKTDRRLGGVCGGIARATGTPTWIWRAVFVILALTYAVGLVAYVVLWIFMPDEGEPIQHDT